MMTAAFIVIAGLKNPSEAMPLDFGCDCSATYNFKMSQGGIYSSGDTLRFVAVPINCSGVIYTWIVEGHNFIATGSSNILEYSVDQALPIGTSNVTQYYAVPDGNGGECLSPGITQQVTRLN